MEPWNTSPISPEIPAERTFIETSMIEIHRIAQNQDKNVFQTPESTTINYNSK